MTLAVVYIISCSVRISYWQYDLMFPGCILPAVCLVPVGYVINEVLAVCLITASVAFSAISHAGFDTNPLDLAPQHSGESRCSIY